MSFSNNWAQSVIDMYHFIYIFFFMQYPRNDYIWWHCYMKRLLFTVFAILCHSPPRPP